MARREGRILSHEHHRRAVCPAIRPMCGGVAGMAVAEHLDGFGGSTAWPAWRVLPGAWDPQAVVQLATAVFWRL